MDNKTKTQKAAQKKVKQLEKDRAKRRKIRESIKKREAMVPQDQRRAIAAQLIVEGKLTRREIGEVVGVSARHLQNWAKKPDFQEMIENARLVYSKRFLTEGLAQRGRRLLVLNQVHEKVLDAVTERANSDDMQNVPGGTTGMVAKQIKGIGKGDDFAVIETYSIDTPVVKSILEIHNAVREELGENKQRLEMTGPDGQPLQPPQLQVQFIEVKTKPHVVDKIPAPRVIEGLVREVKREPMTNSTPEEHNAIRWLESVRS
jgi:hypothetical protein